MHKIGMKIKRITIVKAKHGMDTIVLHTDLPDACFPYDAEKASMMLFAAQGFGEEYCKEHFSGVPVTVTHNGH